ncbi:MAG: non-homologous end-joining DNA ligase [Acidimicrobiaceae bacterium]|nr:non-homologous end-joining DNA ligase [Acidimicrobiaceae bacterium]
MAQSDSVALTVDGRELRVSSPSKVFFAARGETKLDLIRYYLSAAEPLMRAVGGRPVMLERHPDGASGKSFFQKRVPKGAPEWLTTTTVSTPNGTLSNAMVVSDLAHVAWAVNMGCLGFHVWPFRADNPDFADELRIDLDPQPGVGFEQVREAAHEVRAAFDELRMSAYIKTSGRRGLHVYCRLESRWDSYQVRAAAVALARELSRRRPDLITDAWWKEQRGRRVFVDFNQNAPHKTVFGAWSVRPRVAGQVSAPFRWDQLDEVQPEDLTIATVGEHLQETGDPWKAINDEVSSLQPLLDWHARDTEAGLPDAPWPPAYPKMPDEPPRVAPSRARAAGPVGESAGSRAPAAGGDA